MKKFSLLGGALGGTLALALGLTACGGSTPAPAGSASSGSTSVNTSAPLYDELPQAIKDKGELVFAADSHPPYRTLGADGSTITGLDPELQAALSEVLGVPTRSTLAEGLPQMLTGMQSGRYDAFNGPVKATPERLQEFDGVSWLTSRTSYLIPTDGGVAATDTAGLCGTTTAGVKGSITEEQTANLSTWCQEQGQSAVTFLGLADTNATLLAVGSGRAQSAATTQTGAMDIQTQQDGKWRYVAQTEEQGAGVDQLVLLTPKSSGMGEVMLKAFEEIFDSGAYQKIVEKWGLQEVAVERPVLNPSVD